MTMDDDARLKLHEHWLAACRAEQEAISRIGGGLDSADLAGWVEWKKAAESAEAARHRYLEAVKPNWMTKY
jgi:hypothetical protein